MNSSEGSARKAREATGFFEYYRAPHGVEIDGDKVRPIWSDSDSKVMPATEDRLPFELAAIVAEVRPNSDEFEKRAVSFVRRWGLLNTPMNELKPDINDSLADIKLGN